MIRLSVLAAAALPLAAGCNVFDESLYLNAVQVDAAPDAPSFPDAAPDQAPGSDASPVLLLTDRCESAVQVVPSSNTPHGVDTTGLSADYSDFAACVGAELRGNDGFVSVEMKMGEKWHVHVNSTSTTLNPAIYILSSCDERTCNAASAIDDCGAGRPEHLSFVAPRTGSYLVGLDSRDPGGGLYSVLVIRPVCGNNVPDHSETCDDGNTTSGDGCDSLCRKELTPGAADELEPNDDPLAANVVAARSLEIGGRLGGRCDQDMFAITLSEGSAVHARILDAAGRPCVRTTSASLVLIAPNGEAVLGRGEAAAGEGCPSIDERHAFAAGLRAGTYFLRTATSDVDTFEYRLKVELP